MVKVILLDGKDMAACRKAADDRLRASARNFSWATKSPTTTQFKVEMVGVMAEYAFAIGWDQPMDDLVRVGRSPGATDFTINGYSIEVKSTYCPPERNPRMAISPDGKRSDLYVLAYSDIENEEVSFLGWARDDDFPTEPEYLPGWHNPTLSIPTRDLRPFRYERTMIGGVRGR